MGKTFFALALIAIATAFIYRDTITTDWLGMDLSGPSSLTSGMGSFGQSLGGSFKSMGDAFR